MSHHSQVYRGSHSKFGPTFPSFFQFLPKSPLLTIGMSFVGLLSDGERERKREDGGVGYIFPASSREQQNSPL